MTGDRTDRYLRGELSPAEARELAQASLDSPELFEELADSALAKAALQSAALPGEKIVPFYRKTWFLIGGVAAAVLLISLAVLTPWQTANPHLQPVLTLTSPAQPVLLAAGLQPPQTAPDSSPVFRSPETASRAPQTAGSVVLIEDGLATIDLGSLDGLAKDSELQVFRDDRSTAAIGRLHITTVFRERARGRILEGQLRVKDRVRVDDLAHLEALLEQVDALYNRGDADAAYKTAEQASHWVGTAKVPSIRQAALWNQLAVLRMLRGDYRGAEEPLTRAVAASPKSGLAYARSINNLGVMAELLGSRRTAQSRYADAVRALADIANPPEQDRRSAQANLDRLRGLH